MESSGVTGKIAGKEDTPGQWNTLVPTGRLQVVNMGLRLQAGEIPYLGGRGPGTYCAQEKRARMALLGIPTG